MKNLGCFFHITWATKYRRKTFHDPDFGSAMLEIIENVFEYIEKDFEILVVDVDHVHILMKCNPNKPISPIINRLKSISAKRWNRLYHTTNEKVWQNGYSCATVSFSRYEDLENYLDHHNLMRQARG